MDVKVKKLNEEEIKDYGYNNDKVFVMFGSINNLGVAKVKYALTKMEDCICDTSKADTYIEFLLDFSDKNCLLKDMKIINPIISMFQIDALQILLTEMSKRLIYAFNNNILNTEIQIVNALDPIRNNLTHIITDNMNVAYKQLCEENNIKSLLNIKEN